MCKEVAEKLLNSEEETVCELVVEDWDRTYG